MDIRTALDHRLAFTKYGEMTPVTIVGSELPCGANYDHVLAVPHKDTTFHGGCINEAVLAVVNVNIGSNVKHKVFPVFA